MTTKLKEHDAVAFQSQWGWWVRWVLLSGPQFLWHVERYIHYGKSLQRRHGDRQQGWLNWPEETARRIFSDSVRHEVVNPNREAYP